MKTNHAAKTLLRPFTGKTILGALFAAGALATTLTTLGCSGDAQPIVTHQDCASLTTSHGKGPSVQVSVKSNGVAPDVTILGNGFPPGAPISIGYFGLPPQQAGGATVQLDLPALGQVNADGTFAVIQHGVYDVTSCDSAAESDTISIAAGAGGTVAGTSAPARFWCANETPAAYDSPCE